MRGADIRINRDKKGIHQIALAQALGIHPNTLSDIERELIPTLEEMDATIDRLASEKEAELRQGAVA